MNKPADPLQENVKAVADLERELTQNRSALDRLSHAIAAIASSRAFIVGHVVLVLVWAFLNRGQRAFDAYPYGLLNLLVSLEAIFLTGTVLLTQNQMSKLADRRAHLDLQVNLLAEQELTAILQMVHTLCKNAGTTVRIADSRVNTLLQETDIEKLAVTIDRELAKDDPRE